MERDHLEGTGLHTRSTSVTVIWRHQDGPRGAICTQGLSRTGGHTGRTSAQTTHVRFIESQGFVLGQADAGGCCPKSPIMGRHAGYLTGPAAAAQVWANLDPFSFVVHGPAPTVALSRESDADASTQRRPSSASRARQICGRPSRVGLRVRFLLHLVIQQIACGGKIICALPGHDATSRVLLPADYDQRLKDSRGPGQHVGFWLRGGWRIQRSTRWRQLASLLMSFT